MINIVFFSDSDILTGFFAVGHSDHSEEGTDIVCAAVSSAAYMTANTVTEILRLSPRLSVEDGNMLLRFKSMSDADRAADIMNGFRLHIEELQKQYPEFINVTITEV